MSGSQSEQQGWFHRMTGKPFGQTFGIQKAPSQLEIMQKKQREDLQKAMERKKQIEDELKQKDLNVTKYQKQISELQKEQFKNYAATQGRMVVKEIDSDWGYTGGLDPTDSNYDDRNAFHQTRHKLATEKKEAKGSLKSTELESTNLKAELVKVQSEISQKTPW
jgi:dsDNA-specific endonuclease/ATPase MutS2